MKPRVIHVYLNWGSPMNDFEWMMKYSQELVVSQEAAIKLKETGFDKPCASYYVIRDDVPLVKPGRHTNKAKYGLMNHNDIDSCIVSAPSISDARLWLFRNHIIDSIHNGEITIDGVVIGPEQKYEKKYTIEDVMTAAQFGFENALNAHNNGLWVMPGNIAQWLCERHGYLETIPEDVKAYMKAVGGK